MNIVKKCALILFCLFGITPGIAAGPPAEPTLEQQKELTLADIRNQRKQIVAANMDITADQAQVFWPVYEDYQSGLQSVNDRKINLIEAYAKAYNANSLTDQQAKAMLGEFLSIETDRLQIKKKFIPRFQEILPAKKVTRFYQIDNKLDSIINFELARSIPLVQ
ncbi:MAG: hypothetical protein L0Z68_09965 [Gammaproteobacteria bacterium]|nr:hypothetical protein [Gammaproteobacteria bacterium]